MGRGGRNPSPGCSSGSYELGEPCISLSLYPRLDSSPRKRERKKHSLKTCCQRKGTLVEEEAESLGTDCGGGASRD